MKTRITSESIWFWLLSLLFAVVASYLTMRATKLYGAGLSPDSTGYIRLARDISENGFSFLLEGKAISQPPLYPVILATASLLSGAEVLKVTAWINVTTSAALVVVILLSVGRVTTFIPVIAVAGLLACFSIPLSHVWSMAWTEPFFILMVSLVFLLVTGTQHPIRSAIFAGLLTAAACFTRYAGIVLLPVVSAFLFFSQAGTAGRRCKYVTAYALLPTVLLALYVFRNYALSGTPAGGRSPGQTSFADNVDLATDVVVAWFLPWPIRSFETLLLTAFALLGALAWSQRMHIVHVIRNSAKIVFLCAAFCVAYTGFIVWTSTTTSYDPIDDRLLSPLYPSLLVLFALLLKPGSWRSQTASLVALGAFCLLFLVAPFRATYSEVNRKAEQGAGGYHSRHWQESALVTYFKHTGQPKEETLFSNGPDVLYILADVEADMSPDRRHYNSERTTGGTEENLFTKYPSLEGALLAWFDQVHRDYLFAPGDLEAMCDLEVVKTFTDGTVYRIRSSNRLEK